MAALDEIESVLFLDLWLGNLQEGEGGGSEDGNLGLAPGLCLRIIPSPNSLVLGLVFRPPSISMFFNIDRWLDSVAMEPLSGIVVALVWENLRFGLIGVLGDSISVPVL
jgi:hypothetical protein